MGKSVERPKVKKFRYHIKFEYMKENFVRQDSIMLDFDKEAEDDNFIVGAKQFLSAKFVDVTIVGYQLVKTVMV